MKKEFQAAVVGIMTGTLVLSCNTTTQITMAAKQPVTLRVVTMFGGTDPSAAVYETLKENFQKEYDYITIEDESRTSDEEWKSSVAADFCVGNEPDVLQFFTDATANQLVATDKFVTIAEIRQEYPEYAADTKDWALQQVANRDGIERAVPTTGYWEGMYCNQDLFERYGIPIPTDWNSLVYAIGKFQSEGIVPIACSLTNVPHYWMEYLLLYASGPDEYEATYRVAPEDWINGLETFQTLRNIGAFPKNTDTVNNDYVTRLFEEKKAAMLLEGSWYLSSVADQENTIVTAFPGIGNQKAVSGTIVGGMTTGFYITRRAWNDPAKRDAAVRFVMANTSKEAVQQYWESGGAVATTATEVTPVYDLTPLAESARSYVEAAEKTVLPTDSRMDPEAYKTLINGILNVSAGGSAENLLKEVLEINLDNQR